MHVKHNGFRRDLATEQKKRQIWNIKMFKRKKKIILYKERASLYGRSYRYFKGGKYVKGKIEMSSISN